MHYTSCDRVCLAGRQIAGERCLSGEMNAWMVDRLSCDWMDGWMNGWMEGVMRRRGRHGALSLHSRCIGQTGSVSDTQTLQLINRSATHPPQLIANARQPQ